MARVVCAEFFDEEGFFAEEDFMRVVKDFVSEYELMLRDESAGKKEN